MTVADCPLVHPERPTSQVRPLKAWGHFRRLLADKEDTSQVFHISESLKTRRSFRQAKDFIRSAEGQRYLAANTNIPAMMDDHARWAHCGPNTVAAHYVRFMRREGLSAAGLVAETAKFREGSRRYDDLIEWYFERVRDTHDLFHILMGYGRDPLGEASILGFTYEQNRNPGILFIAYAAAVEIKRITRTKAPIFGSIQEGRRLGRAAATLAHMDVERVMEMDLEEARAMLNVGNPSVYHECIRVLEAEGNSEAAMLSQAKAAA